MFIFGEATTQVDEVFRHRHGHLLRRILKWEGINVDEGSVGILTK